MKLFKLLALLLVGFSLNANFLDRIYDSIRGTFDRRPRIESQRVVSPTDTTATGTYVASDYSKPAIAYNKPLGTEYKANEPSATTALGSHNVIADKTAYPYSNNGYPKFNTDLMEPGIHIPKDVKY